MAQQPGRIPNHICRRMAGQEPSRQWDSISTITPAALISTPRNRVGKNVPITMMAGNDGTINEDIRHVACELAWFIWFDASWRGWTVNIVAHSTGGIITQWALATTPHDPNFPPYLLVQNVVTMGTPFGGAPTGYGDTKCNQLGVQTCLQAAEMETNDPNHIIPDLQE